MARPAASTNQDPAAAGGNRPDGCCGVSADAIQLELRKILASETFSHSERLCRFLRFTVEEAVQGRGAKLKEYQIGVEVFDRKAAYDPRADPIVRVEAGRLRAKLEEYYRAEGRDDPVLISFRKGSYVPAFGPALARPSPRQRVACWLRALRQREVAALLASTIVAVVAVSWTVTLFFENLALRKQIRAASLPRVERDLALLWGRFLWPGANNLLILGSPVFFVSPRQGLFLRWQGLTETADYAHDPQFQEMQRRFGPLSEPRHDYALMGDALAAQRLTAFFGRAGASLAALPVNLANWEALQDTNLIFLGAPRMLPLLARLPVQQDFEWDANHNVVNRNPQPGEQRKYVTSSHYDLISYAIVAHFPGLQTNRQILLLTAHSAPGISAALDHMTQPERARELVQKLGLSEAAGPGDYQVLIRVVVDRGVRVKSEYVTHHRVSSPSPKP